MNDAESGDRAPFLVREEASLLFGERVYPENRLAVSHAITL